MTTFNLDCNASMGLLPEIEARLLEDGLLYLNPSSIHRGGQKARAVVEDARESIKKAVSTDGTVVFTSGATESNNTALMMPFWYRLGSERRGNLAISAVEHPAITAMAEQLGSLGVGVRIVKPRDGKFLAEDFLSHCDEETRIVSCMWVNNETGQILPVHEIAEAVKDRFPHIIFHSDAVQAFGKFQINFDATAIDLLSISGHKVGALSGVGAIVSKKGREIYQYLYGGPQESRRRAGTENVLGIYSFGLAADALRNNFDVRRSHYESCGAALTKVISELAPKARINFSEIETVPSTVSVTVPGVSAADLVVGLDVKGVLASSGSACASGKPQPSAVLLAMGFSEDEARSTIRLSLGVNNSIEEIEKAGVLVAEVINRMSKSV